MQQISLGTRGSPLALYQARATETALSAQHPDLRGRIDTTIISTTGDQVRDRPLADAGGKGLFTRELDAALADGRIDLAVHSLKDVPGQLPDGLCIAATLPRADPRDVWIGRTSVHDLPAGAKVGTCSPRRAAQILAQRPDLDVVPLRGNVDTRLGKVAAGDLDGTFLAAAGLDRLELSPPGCERLSPAFMLPAVAQGAIAIMCRTDDAQMRSRLVAINCADTWVRIVAERTLLADLDGSCRTPIAGLAELDGDRLTLDALIADEAGKRVERQQIDGTRADAADMGHELAARLRRAAPELLPPPPSETAV